MAAPSLCLLVLLLAVSRALHAFPADVDPITITVGRDSESLPVFLGEDDSTNSSLNVQLLLLIGARLLIAGRDHVFTVDLEPPRAWRHHPQREADVDGGAPGGGPVSHERQDGGGVSQLHQGGCATRRRTPLCVRHQRIQPHVQELPGRAAAFAGERLYSATAVDPLGVDAVVYGSLARPPLRSLKLDPSGLKGTDPPPN
ncbi:semaphorin-6A-like [Lethenteron reissneri]|uniref:semaphorin-6A-like n=1 Tax=Lethenteron reissneri TaxID=7753 RepID=UPI002AB6CA2F|nr:semaphorin-6A-like [Lethenteron reissneri]